LRREFKVRKTLKHIEEPDPTDTCLDFSTLPPIIKPGDEDLVCGACAAVIAQSVSPRDLYLAAAGLLRNRLPSRLVITCADCRKYNVVPAPIGLSE